MPIASDSPPAPSAVTRRTILVTDGEQRAALALVRSLGRAGHTVYVCSNDGHSLAGASRWAVKDEPLPDALSHPDAFVDALRTFAQRTDADTIIPVTEAALLAVLPARETFGSVVIPFAEADAFVRISDKQRVLAQARNVGIAIPAQRVIETAEDVDHSDFATLKYPIVIKPARSVAVSGETRMKFSVRHAENEAALRNALTDLDRSAYPVLLQQRIVGPGVGIFLLIWGGETLAAFSHRRIREKPPSGGVSVYRESHPLDETLVHRSKALLDAFDWRGVAMVEYKIDTLSGTPYLMEINGRFWGSLQLAIEAGVDFPTLLLRAAYGPPPAPVTIYMPGVRSRWWLGDLDHLLARLRHSDQRLALPPGEPSRLAALTNFIFGDRRDRDEICQPGDRRPFFRELRLWLKNLA